MEAEGSEVHGHSLLNSELNAGWCYRGLLQNTTMCFWAALYGSPPLLCAAFISFHLLSPEKTKWKAEITNSRDLNPVPLNGHN